MLKCFIIESACFEFYFYFGNGDNALFTESSSHEFVRLDIAHRWHGVSNLVARGRTFCCVLWCFVVFCDKFCERCTVASDMNNGERNR